MRAITVIVAVLLFAMSIPAHNPTSACRGDEDFVESQELVNPDTGAILSLAELEGANSPNLAESCED